MLLTLFLQTINIILPDARARDYVLPAKRFAWLNAQVRERYKDTSMSFGKAGEKTKKLINQHLIGLGVNPKVPPVDLLSPNFMTAPKTNKEDTSAKASAFEMEHVLRKHITVRMEEDPALYGSLSVKLNSILQADLKNWDKQAQQLLGLVTEVKAGRVANAISDVTSNSAPLYEQVVSLVEKFVKPSAQDKESLKSLVNDLVPVFQQELSMPSFWSKDSQITELKGIVENRLVYAGVAAVMDRTSELAQDMVQLARHGDLLAA